MLHANTSQWYEKSVLLFHLTVRIQLSKHQPIVPCRVYKLTWNNCLGLLDGYLHPQPACPKALNWDKNWHLGNWTDLGILIFSRICFYLPLKPYLSNLLRMNLQIFVDCYKCAFPAGRNCTFPLCSSPVKEGKHNFRVSWKVFIKAASSN